MALGAIKTWAKKMAADGTSCVESTRANKCSRWLFGNSGLGTEYVKCVQDPVQYLQRMFGKQYHNFPKWYKAMVDLDASFGTTPLDGILWLLSQFIVLTPITDPAVVAHRYALYQKSKIKMVPLAEVIKLSAQGVGFMQCNCRNGMHYGIDPHCTGDLLRKGIIVDFTNQGDNDPTALASRGANSRNGRRVLQPGSAKVKQIVAPVFQNIR